MLIRLPFLLLETRKRTVQLERGTRKQCPWRVPGAHAQGFQRVAGASPTLSAGGNRTAEGEPVWRPLM